MRVIAALAMAQSWRSGAIVEYPHIQTIADGIGVRVPIPEALQDLRGLVDEVLLVEDKTTGLAAKRTPPALSASGWPPFCGGAT